MKTTICIILLLSLTTLSLTKTSGAIGYNCFRWLEAGNGFYNLDKINSSKAMEVSLQSSSTGKAATLYFNPCHPISVEGCEGDGSIGFVKDSDNNCIPLSKWTSSKDDPRTKWEFVAIDPVSSYSYIKTKVRSLLLGLQNVADNGLKKSAEELDANLQGTPDLGDYKGLQLTANNGDALAYNFQMTMNCKKDASSITDLAASWDAQNKLYSVSFTNQHSCSFDVFSFWNKLGWGKYIVQVIAAILCLALCFAGIKMYKPSLGIIGFFAGGAACYVLLSMFWTQGVDTDWYMWVVIAISVLVGIVVCVLLVTLERFAGAVCGALLGYVIGNWIYELVLYKLDGTGTPIWYYVIVILLAIVFAILSIKIYDWMMILALSIGGSYFGVKLIGLMAGNYPDETWVANEIESGEIESLPWPVYMYLAIMVVLAIGGIVTQSVIKKNMDKRKKNDGEFNGLM